MSTIPAIFISHGSPMLLIDGDPAAEFFVELVQRLPKPRAVLCISAHWEESSPAVTATLEPRTIYDFWGFPPHLYQIKYTAPGSPELAAEIVSLLKEAGITCRLDTARGLDHGAWVPLMKMYPEADLPVLQLSVQTSLGPQHHYQLGRALAPLRTMGVLILGSGGATHNLREIFGRERDAKPESYAVDFDEWLAEKIAAADTEPLLDYLRMGPSAIQNHPTAEHFLPLFVPMGAALGATGRRIYHRINYGVLSMAAFSWGDF